MEQIDQIDNMHANMIFEYMYRIYVSYSHSVYRSTF